MKKRTKYLIMLAVCCIVLVGGSLTAFAYSHNFSLTPIGLGDWKATGAVYKTNSTMNSYASVTAVQGGGTLSSYIANRYVAQLSNAINITNGSNKTYNLNASSYDGYYIYVVQSLHTDIYGRNTYGTWQP